MACVGLLAGLHRSVSATALPQPLHPWVTFCSSTAALPPTRADRHGCCGWQRGPDESQHSRCLKRNPTTDRRDTRWAEGITEAGVHAHAAAPVRALLPTSHPCSYSSIPPLSPAGFFDPFDELVAARSSPALPPSVAAPSTAAPPTTSANRPISHTPSTDPLDFLWRGSDLDPLGASGPVPVPASTSGDLSTHPAATATEGGPQGSGQQPDFWAFDFPPSPARSGSAPTRPSGTSTQRAPFHHHLQQAKPAAAAASTGDLLQLDDEEDSISRGNAQQQNSRDAARARTQSAGDLAALDKEGGGGPSSSSQQDASSQQNRSQSTSGQQQGADGEAGTSTEQRELLIYAVPLTREKLVFLPVMGWSEGPPEPPAGVCVCVCVCV